MATQLFVREENGSSMISQEGAYIQDKAARLVSNLLTEVEEDGAVDLRDLESILNSAVTDVILREVIRRRLS